MPVTRTIVFAILAALACTSSLMADDPRDLEWLELMPEDEAAMWLDEQGAINHQGMSAPDAFQSFRTVAELDGERVRIPGFVVPVEVDENQMMSEFFLVPYFGACIHVPPPPANQIIYGRMKEPIEVVNIWDAFWMEGTLNIEEVENETAASAYTMSVESLELYD